MIFVMTNQKSALTILQKSCHRASLITSLCDDDMKTILVKYDLLSFYMVLDLNIKNNFENFLSILDIYPLLIKEYELI